MFGSLPTQQHHMTIKGGVRRGGVGGLFLAVHRAARWIDSEESALTALLPCLWFFFVAARILIKTSGLLSPQPHPPQLKWFYSHAVSQHLVLNRTSSQAALHRLSWNFNIWTGDRRYVKWVATDAPGQQINIFFLISNFLFVGRCFFVYFCFFLFFL